jgi:hypothetical protein
MDKCTSGKDWAQNVNCEGTRCANALKSDMNVTTSQCRLTRLASSSIFILISQKRSNKSFCCTFDRLATLSNADNGALTKIDLEASQCNVVNENFHLSVLAVAEGGAYDVVSKQLRQQVAVIKNI